MLGGRLLQRKFLPPKVDDSPLFTLKWDDPIPSKYHDKNAYRFRVRAKHGRSGVCLPWSTAVNGTRYSDYTADVADQACVRVECVCIRALATASRRSQLIPFNIKSVSVYDILEEYVIFSLSKLPFIYLLHSFIVQCHVRIVEITIEVNLLFKSYNIKQTRINCNVKNCN